MQTESSPRRIDLHRRVARIWPDRIEVKPSRGAVVVPAVGLAAGILSFVAAVTLTGAVPFALTVAFLLVALLAIPLAGVGFVYAAFGADIVVDRNKQSLVWQQGFLGMGVGTQELVPFWKVKAIEVVETTARGPGEEPESVAQYEVGILKTSGRRLRVGAVTYARAMAEDARAHAMELAQALAGMTGAPITEPRPEELAAAGEGGD
ncbi:MAG TPA: hypothetical protein VNN12_00535 [Dehalococcoidia bacterium]|nr:hypothetical protein [Dehalococcoidia bacterium]